MIMPYIEEQQTSADMISEFRGYNHNPVINDNEFFDMENMTTDATPSIETRAKRGKLNITDNGDPIEVLAVTGKEKIMVAYSKEGSNSIEVTGDVEANMHFSKNGDADIDCWERDGTDFYIKLEDDDYRTDHFKEILKEAYDGDTNVRLFAGSNGTAEHPIIMGDTVKRKVEQGLWTAEWLTNPFLLFDKYGECPQIDRLEWLYPSGDGWGAYGYNYYSSTRIGNLKNPIACPNNCDYIGIRVAFKKDDDTPAHLKAECRVYTNGNMFTRSSNFEGTKVFFGNDTFTAAPNLYDVYVEKGMGDYKGTNEQGNPVYYYTWYFVIHDPNHTCPLRNWGYGGAPPSAGIPDAWNTEAYNASKKMYICYGEFNYPSLCYTGYVDAQTNRGADSALLRTEISVDAEIELLRTIQPLDKIVIGDDEAVVESVDVTSNKITIFADHPAISDGDIIGYPSEGLWLAQLDLETNQLKNQTIACELKRKYDQDGNEIKQKHQIVEMGANIVLFPEKYVINTADTEKIWRYDELTSESAPGDWSDYSSFFELDDGEYVQLTEPTEYVANHFYRRTLIRERYTSVKEIEPYGFYCNPSGGMIMYGADFRSVVGKTIAHGISGASSSSVTNAWYVCNTDPVTAITSATYYAKSSGGTVTGTFTPPNVTDGDLWIDTSESPNIIKQRVGSMWVEREYYFQLAGSSNEAPLLRDGDAVNVSFTDKDDAKKIAHYIYGEKRQEFTVAGTYQYSQSLNYAFIPTTQIKFNFPSTDKVQLISLGSPQTSIVTSDFTDTTYFLSGNKMFVQRYVPIFDYVIESNNRLWGCRYGENARGDFVNEIFASKLGDPTSWTYMRNTAEDSYYVSLGDDGAFTGAVNFNGTPVFFRKDRIHRILGHYPSQFQLQTVNADGVDDGSENSITVLNGVVYYNSPHGVMAWNGGVPQNISKAFGEKSYTDGASGHIKNKLYFSLMDGEEPVIFCFDTDKGLWCKENNDRFTNMFDWEGKLYGVNGNELTIFEGAGGELEDDLPFMIQSGDMGYTSMYRKYINKITMRIKLPLGSRAIIEIQYDSDGVWRYINELKPARETRTYAVPIMPHRCDHFAIRIRGKGKMTILQMSKFWKEGTDYA